MEFSSSNYEPVPWEDETIELVSLETYHCLKAIQRIQPGTASQTLLQEHALHADICSIYFSNLIEEKGLAMPETTKLVSSVLSASGPEESSLYISQMEGGPSIQASRREVVQHASALKYMRDEMVPAAQLSEEQVLHMHGIMMAGMVREDGLAVQPGSYRTGKDEVKQGDLKGIHRPNDQSWK